MKNTIKYWIFIVSAHITILCVTLPIGYEQVPNIEPIVININAVSTMEAMKIDLLGSASAPIYTDYEISLIERVTMSEASTQSYECQIAVAQTIINRLNSGRYGESIESIIQEPNQYSTSNNGAPSESVKMAVQEAIYVLPYPETMVYFREGYFHTFANAYNKIGVLYFSTY